MYLALKIGERFYSLHLGVTHLQRSIGVKITMCDKKLFIKAIIYKRIAIKISPNISLYCSQHIIISTCTANDIPKSSFQVKCVPL